MPLQSLGATVPIAITGRSLFVPGSGFGGVLILPILVKHVADLTHPFGIARHLQNLDRGEIFLSTRRRMTQGGEQTPADQHGNIVLATVQKRRRLSNRQTPLQTTDIQEVTHMDRDQIDLRRLLGLGANVLYFFIYVHTYISSYGNKNNPPARLARVIITQNAIPQRIRARSLIFTMGSLPEAM